MLPSTRFSNTTPTLFNNFFDGFLDDIFDIGIKYPTVRSPLNDIIETDKEFVVETALAGMKKEDISLDINDNILTIKAERKNDNEDKQYNRREIFYGKYEKSFSLPENVNVEKIDASYTDGILKLTIPKVEKDQKISKVIEIK